MVLALSIVFLEAQYRARFAGSKPGISLKPEKFTFPVSSEDSSIPHAPDGFRGASHLSCDLLCLPSPVTRSTAS